MFSAMASQVDLDSSMLDFDSKYGRNMAEIRTYLRIWTLMYGGLEIPVLIRW